MRVSSEEQGESGFGLQSQEAEIKAYAELAGYRILQWKREVASAKGGDSLSRRPVLQQVIASAQQLRVPVLISRLDRLSRDAAELRYLAGQSGVEFISIREPGASDPVVLKAQSARIEHETRMLSDRTKAGLERAKREGRRLGNTKNLDEARAKAALSISEKATLRRRELEPIIAKIKAAGAKTAKQIAQALNERSYPTPSGRPWTGPNVQKILKDIQPAMAHSDEQEHDDRRNQDPLWGIW